MSDKIDGSNPVNFKNTSYKHEKKSTEINKAAEKTLPEDVSFKGSDLGVGNYGRAQLNVNSNGVSKNIKKDIEYFNNNPELVSFCGEMFDHYAAEMPYLDAVEKAHSCADVFKTRSEHSAV